MDIRAFPVSRRLPHFNRESLEMELPKHGIRYVWMKALGGYRKAIRKDSPHTALRNASFRNYADYTLTPEFVEAMDELLQFARHPYGLYVRRRARLFSLPSHDRLRLAHASWTRSAPHRC